MLVKQNRVLFVIGLILTFVMGLPGRAMALEIGDKAPDFTLPSTNGEKVSLSQFRGEKIVLLEFYGADFSPT